MWLALALLTVCGQPDSGWDEDVYVWQRLWSEPVLDSVRQASPYVDRFRILTAHWGMDGESVVVDLAPGKSVFRARRIVPVVRLKGSQVSVPQDAVLEVLERQIRVFRDAGAEVKAVEINHNAGMSAVADYAEWLDELHSGLSEDLELWITVLPEWRDVADIERLLERVDRYTLQVHAVSGSGNQLMDSDLALDWIRHFSGLSGTPFFTALPNYQMRAGLGESGEIQFLEEGSATSVHDVEERRLFVSPRELIEWEWSVSLDRPAQAVGMVWFRLPIAGERNIIDMTTFQQVLRGHFPEAEMELHFEPSKGSDEIFNVTMVNRGPHDDAWLDEVKVPEGCTSGEGFNGFSFDGRWGRFSHESPELLHVGDVIEVGRVRCTSGMPVNQHED